MGTEDEPHRHPRQLICAERSNRAERTWCARRHAGDSAGKEEANAERPKDSVCQEESEGLAGRVGMCIVI